MRLHKSAKVTERLQFPEIRLLEILALQRHFESFPFFEFCKAAFTVRLVGLVIALLMIAHEGHNILRFPLRIRQAPFD